MINRLNQLREDIKVAEARYERSKYHSAAEANDAYVMLIYAYLAVQHYVAHLVSLADKVRRAVSIVQHQAEFVWCIWATKCMVKEPWKNKLEVVKTTVTIVG